MISARFALPVLALLCLALVPTVTHAYLKVTVDDGLTAAAVSETVAGLRGRDTSRSAAWVREHYNSDDWIERQLTGTEGTATVFIARSFDFKRLYHHPENAVLHGHTFERPHTERVGPMTHVPVHVLEGSGANRELAVYALLYEDDFIGNPYVFQLRSSLDLLLSGRKPMTLFLVHQPEVPTDVSLQESLAVRVLHATIRQFLNQRQSTAS